MYTPEFPPRTRFAADQVPLEIDQNHYTLSPKGDHFVYIKGAKKDLTKRLATMQLCARLEGEQLMKPVIIMRNQNPCEDRFEIPDGLKRRLVDFNHNGELKREDEWYDERVIVMWDEKAWFSKPVAIQWFELFEESTRSLRKGINKTPSITIQQDNLGTQNIREIKKFTWEHGMFITNTPEDCTDAVALVDHHLGRRVKGSVSDFFWCEFEKDVTSIRFFCDEITEAEWRIRYTKWVGQAWEDLCNDTGYIMKMAKEVGYCNCLCGCENHLVKLHRSFEYQVREKDSEKTEPLSSEEIEERMENDRMLRKERNARRQRRRMRNRIELSLKKREILVESEV